MLFNANLDALKNALDVEKENYHDKAVQSVRSQVANIIDSLQAKTTLSQFESGLFEFLRGYYNPSEIYTLSPQELTEINGLRDEKYATPEWIYSYSPTFEFSKTIHWKGKQVKISMKIIKGSIKKVQFEGEVKDTLWDTLKEILLDCTYLLPDVRRRIALTVSNEKDHVQLAMLLF